MRTDILERKEEILSWIAEELTLYEIKQRLGCKYETLRLYLKKMGIEYKGQQARKGQYKGKNRYESIEEYLAKARCIKSHELKQKLIYFEIKEARCEVCGLDVWNNKPIPLELHHVDGDHYNNELGNLQILCPNCHAQQSNNSGKAIGKYSTREADRKHKLAEKKILVAQAKADNIINNPGKVDSLGRFYSTILCEEDWNVRKDLIINSKVDLTKFGWKTKVQEVTGLTRRQVDLTVEHFSDYFKDKIYIR
jgi:hypothetical protein